MGRIVVTEFVSMDGVMQAPGGEKFKYEGWTFEFDRGDDGERFKADEVFEAEAQLLGRVTYESFAGAWPGYASEADRDTEEGAQMGAFADRMNSMPKYVVSSTLKDPEWTNCRVIDGDVPKEVAKLKEQVDGDILIAGSRTLVQELLEHDMVDEIRMMVFPVVLGVGDKLFDEFSEKTTWNLAESKPVGPDGVLTLTYRRA
jgi:dihydrofolate reductase